MRDEMTKVQNKSYFNGWLTKLCEEFSEVPFNSSWIFINWIM